jgi:molybdenum cofactor cytidylyltransferase
MPNLAIAILAAGASSRMGQPKQQLVFRGKTLVQNAVDAAVGTGCGTIFLIVNHRERSSQEQTAHQVTILVNESYNEGISSSIRLATEVAMATAGVDGILFMNCDQPFLTTEDLLRLIALHRSGQIVASSFGATIGSPAIFDRVFFHELLELRGDVGAKSIIKKHRGSVIECSMTQAQFDVDTPDDYRALLESSVEGDCL